MSFVFAHSSGAPAHELLRAKRVPALCSRPEARRKAVPTLQAEGSDHYTEPPSEEHDC